VRLKSEVPARPGRGARKLAVGRGELGQKKGDKRRSGVAPVSSSTLGVVAGEVSGLGMVGRPGERMTN
jgi:hypothetical protein